jgi:hypothetical protein
MILEILIGSRQVRMSEKRAVDLIALPNSRPFPASPDNAMFEYGGRRLIVRTRRDRVLLSPSGPNICHQAPGFIS